MNLSAEFDATTGFIFYVIPTPNHQNLNLIIWSFWDLVIGYWYLFLNLSGPVPGMAQGNRLGDWNLEAPYERWSNPDSYG